MYVDQSYRTDSFSQEFDKHAGVYQAADKTNSPLIQLITGEDGPGSTKGNLSKDLDWKEFDKE